jgi:transposase
MSKKFKSSEGYLRVRMLSYLSLPPVSPELNPVEQVWQFLRQHQLTKPDVLKNEKAVTDACCDAWNWFEAQPQRISKLTQRHWAFLAP